MFIARLNSTTGEVKWAKAFHVNESSSSFLNYEMYISEAQIIWFTYYENMTRFIPRIDQEGNILQIIWSGAYNLNSVDFMSFIEILTETDFMMIQFLWRSVNGISINPSSMWDVSVLKMTTTPKVEYNLMIDYNNMFDAIIEIHVVNNTWYIMWLSALSFTAFSYFPVDKNLIDVNMIKNTTLIMKQPNYYEASQFFGNYHIWNNETSPMYKMITFLLVLSKIQLEISLYNATSTQFTKSYFINIQGDISVDWCSVMYPHFKVGDTWPNLLLCTSQ